MSFAKANATPSLTSPRSASRSAQSRRLLKQTSRLHVTPTHSIACLLASARHPLFRSFGPPTQSLASSLRLVTHSFVNSRVLRFSLQEKLHVACRVSLCRRNPGTQLSLSTSPMPTLASKLATCVGVPHVTTRSSQQADFFGCCGNPCMFISSFGCRSYVLYITPLSGCPRSLRPFIDTLHC